MPDLRYMDIDALTTILKDLGYTEVLTSAGWVSLGSWEPYAGLAKARFALDVEQGAIVDDVPGGQVAGIWRLR